MYMMTGNYTMRNAFFSVVQLTLVYPTIFLRLFSRIFALATVMSSVLIYNLPETVSHHPCDVTIYSLMLWYRNFCFMVAY